MSGRWLINGTKSSEDLSAHLVTSEEEHHDYEELVKDSAPCPSCKGTGRIPKELEKQLVALIPFSDKRLKPRRTILYVILAVTICLLASGSLVFFLIPRAVLLDNQISLLLPLNVSINTTEGYESVYLRIQNKFNVSNNNFFAVRISNAAMTALYGEKQIAMATNPKEYTVPLRSFIELVIEMEITFKGEEGYIVRYCDDRRAWIHTLVMIFQTTIDTSYLSHKEQTSLMTYQSVICGRNKS